MRRMIRSPDRILPEHHLHLVCYRVECIRISSDIFLIGSLTGLYNELTHDKDQDDMFLTFRSDSGKYLHSCATFIHESMSEPTISVPIIILLRFIWSGKESRFPRAIRSRLPSRESSQRSTLESRFREVNAPHKPRCGDWIRLTTLTNSRRSRQILSTYK